MSESTQKSIRLSNKDIEQIEKLVEAGYYKNFNDAVTTAIRFLFQWHERVLAVEHPHGEDKNKAVSEVRQ